MKTGRARILEMVKDDKISIEQADELLKALENAQPNTPAQVSALEVSALEGSPFKASPLESSQFGPEHNPRVEIRISRSNNGKYNFEQMIELGKYGVSAKFIRELNEVGLTDLSFEAVIELGKYGISPKFVLEMRQISEEFDLGELNFERIIELGKYGVSAKFVREMIETQMIDFSLPTKQWAQIEPDDEPDDERHDERHEKLQARLEKARAKLSQVKTEHERKTLEGIIDKVTEKLERKLSQVKTEHERETLEKITEKVVEEIERKLSQVDSTQS